MLFLRSSAAAPALWCASSFVAAPCVCAAMLRNSHELTTLHVNMCTSFSDTLLRKRFNLTAVLYLFFSIHILHPPNCYIAGAKICGRLQFTAAAALLPWRHKAPTNANDCSSNDGDGDDDDSEEVVPYVAVNRLPEVSEYRYGPHFVGNQYEWNTPRNIEYMDG